MNPENYDEIYNSSFTLTRSTLAVIRKALADLHSPTVSLLDRILTEGYIEPPVDYKKQWLGCYQLLITEQDKQAVSEALIQGVSRLAGHPDYQGSALKLLKQHIQDWQNAQIASPQSAYNLNMNKSLTFQEAKSNVPRYETMPLNELNESITNCIRTATYGINVDIRKKSFELLLNLESIREQKYHIRAPHRQFWMLKLRKALFGGGIGDLDYLIHVMNYEKGRAKSVRAKFLILKSFLVIAFSGMIISLIVRACAQKYLYIILFIAMCILIFGQIKYRFIVYVRRIPPVFIKKDDPIGYYGSIILSTVIALVLLFGAIFTQGGC